MRKSACVLAVLLLLVLLPGARAAALTYCDVEEYNLIIGVPAGLVAFTRDGADSEANLRLFGWTRADADAALARNGACLLAVPSHLSYDISVVADADDADGEYDALPADGLQTVIDAYVNEYAEQGFTVTGTETYAAARARFIVLEYEYSGGADTLHYLEYRTVTDGKSIRMLLTSYTGPAGDGARVLRQLVDGSSFDGSPPPEPPPEPSPEPPPETVPETVPEAPSPDTPVPLPTPQPTSPGAIISTLFLTIFLCIVPVALFRFNIRKKPLSSRAARIVAIAYGFVILVVAAVSSLFSQGVAPGLAILLWSYVNYRILIYSRPAKEGA